MASRSMIASVILLHPTDEALKKAGKEIIASCKHYFRYAVARLGGHWNVVWNVANEWHRDQVFSYADMDELGSELDRLDPYQHLIACHHYSRFEFYDKAWTDMSSLQHRGMPDEINSYMLQNHVFQKIAINEEYGYEGDNHAPPNTPDHVRQDHWAIAMTGGYGTYGDKTKGPKVAAYFSSVLEDAVSTSVPDTLQHLQAFMEQTGYRHMLPVNMLVSDCNSKEVFCLANPGYEYIVYLVKGQSFKINLTHVHGDLKVTWYNPRTGETLEHPDVCVAQSAEELTEYNEERGWLRIEHRHNVAFVAPDLEHDWVLYLKKE